MGNALMNWDGIQKRWRRRYRGEMLRIKATDLVPGATTATETVLAANRWFRQEQARIDGAAAKATYRPNELEYLAELENIQSAMKSFLLVMRSSPDSQSMLAPNVEILKHKENLLKQALRQDKLSPLDDYLRNPIYVSPDKIEGEVFQDARQLIANQIREQGTIRVPREEWQNIEGYIPHDHPHLGIDDTVYSDYDSNSEFYKRMNLINGHNSNLAKRTFDQRIQTEAGRVVGLKDELLAHRKRELGLVSSESDRGQMIQILKDDGIEVAESRKLEYHIEKFFDAKKQECQLGGISPGRLKKIGCTIDSYKKWSPIINGNVDRIGTKEHIEAYYSHLVQRVLAGEIKPKYAHNLFGDFKMLVFWLVNEEILKDNPRCLQLKSNKYTFPAVRQKPKTATLETVHKILNAANSRLKLCILLTLNCGFGGAEIGRLTKDEYDPKKGRIRHKRRKTEKSDKAPTVCYKLWNETRELLDQEIANRKNYPQRSEAVDYLLVNSNGMPLWNESINTGKNDNINSAFKRLVAKLRKDDPDFPPITYYEFRRTSSTLI
jgi:integrase